MVGMVLMASYLGSLDLVERKERNRTPKPMLVFLYILKAARLLSAVKHE